MTPDWTALRATAGLAWQQLRHTAGRSGLAVCAVALAVLLVVLLAGLGYGMSTTGTAALAWIEHDLWVTGGPVGLAPAGVGGVVNPIEDAHPRAARIERTDGVATAEALAFQTVYVSTDGSDFDTVVGVGTTANGSTFDAGFTAPRRHYAGGSYDGPLTHEVVVDPRTAERYDLAVGDELHVGATLTQARQHRFTVVGISNTFATFLGTPTVVVPLGELQAVSGTTGTDRAALIGVSVVPDADAGPTAARIEAANPDLTVRTKQGQLQAVVARQGAVLTGVATLVGLAVLLGVVLVASVLALSVAHQRAAIAALQAMGVSRGALVATVGWQGLWLGTLGGLVGIAVALPARVVLNAVVADLTGFPALAKLPPAILLGGLLVAVATGVLGATVAGWRVARTSPMEHLDP